MLAPREAEIAAEAVGWRARRRAAMNAGWSARSCSSALSWPIASEKEL